MACGGIILLTVRYGDFAPIHKKRLGWRPLIGGCHRQYLSPTASCLRGTSDTAFSPDATMTRGMIVTVLARYDGVDTTTGETWYEAGQHLRKNDCFRMI